MLISIEYTEQYWSHYHLQVVTQPKSRTLRDHIVFFFIKIFLIKQEFAIIVLVKSFLQCNYTSIQLME